MEITENYTGAAFDELFGLAERENNSKRRNVIVNFRQGKHVPCSPAQSLELFGKLADRIHIDAQGSEIVVIGFAETATAIGAQIAVSLGAGTYIHTTREAYPEEYRVCDFSEEHSHAAEQYLYSDRGTSVFEGIKHIVFVDDELTTGKTILNFINALSGKVSADCRFYAASVLNGMNAENLEKFTERGVGVFWLVKSDGALSAVNKELGVIPRTDRLSGPQKVPEYIRLSLCGKPEPRLGCSSQEMDRLCGGFAREVIEKLGGSLTGVSRIDVVGTEECMYPAIRVGRELEKAGYAVTTHSTTRSPIVPSLSEGYPLNMRGRMPSLYDPDRTVFLYNIHETDMVLVITDAAPGEANKTAERSLMSLFSAKKAAIVYWRNDE